MSRATVAMAALAGLFALGFAGEAYLLKATSDARKAEATALMCFDAADRPTLKDDWVLCERVAYRPISH